MPGAEGRLSAPPLLSPPLSAPEQRGFLPPRMSCCPRPLVVSLSVEILQLLQLEPHNKGADYMLDCGVSWLLRVQKSRGSPQTAITTALMLAQHSRAPEMWLSALLYALLGWGGGRLAHFRVGEMEALGKGPGLEGPGLANSSSCTPVPQRP